MDVILLTYWRQQREQDSSEYAKEKIQYKNNEKCVYNAANRVFLMYVCVCVTCCEINLFCLICVIIIKNNLQYGTNALEFMLIYGGYIELSLKAK